MLFSRDWIGQYVELPGDDEELARRLTFAGLAVEGREVRDGDLLLDLDVTTNRPDCMSHLGVAREVSVLLERPLRPPALALEESDEETRNAVTVEVDPEAVEACPRYVARVVRGVRVGPSPEWLAARLEAIGQRPINNIVDVTNYVLWEWGQPLHVFDLAKLRRRRIEVRRGREGEELTTLDGEARSLDGEVLVIADGAGPVALAGIMGGLESEVTQGSADVVIESAHFRPRDVRRGARKLGMHTDASHRFERGADPGACLDAATRAARLMAEVAGGTVLAGAEDRRAEDWEERWRLQGELALDRLAAFAGAPVDAREAERWLAGLGFRLRRGEPGHWLVEVPSWRYYDFAQGPTGQQVHPADLYEEVMRIFGFDRIPAALPTLAGPDLGASRSYRRRQRLQTVLEGLGYRETISYAFQDRESLERFSALEAEGEPLRLVNPLSERYEVMRRSLLPGLLETARFNIRRGASLVRFFEVGHVFPGGEEELELVGLVAGGETGSSWERGVELDLFDLKGALEALAAASGLTFQVRPAALPGMMEGTGGEILGADGERVGVLGRIALEDAPFPLFAGEIRSAFLASRPGPEPVRRPSRFPGVDVDLTLTHSLDVCWARIESALEELELQDLVRFGLKYRYEGEGVPEGAVSTTISFHYNAEDRSLTQEEVNRRHAEVIQALEERFGLETGGSHGG